MAAVPDKALALAVTKRMLYGEEPPLVGVGLMLTALHLHGAIQCCLHASACMACCWLQCGVGGQAKFITTPLCEHLQDE